MKPNPNDAVVPAQKSPLLARKGRRPNVEPTVHALSSHSSLPLRVAVPPRVVVSELVHRNCRKIRAGEREEGGIKDVRQCRQNDPGA